MIIFMPNIITISFSVVVSLVYRDEINFLSPAN